MSAETLAAALAALGLPGHVEARGSLAILTATDPAVVGAMSDAAIRGEAVALASRHGFATLALEFAPQVDQRATVSGD